jgi:hypothetical protein
MESSTESRHGYIHVRKYKGKERSQNACSTFLLFFAYKGEGGGTIFETFCLRILNVTLLCKKIEEISSTFHTWVMGHVT